jgi:hypothetical protein
MTAEGQGMSMEEASVFTRVEAGLEAVLEELRRLEPIFHTQEFGRTVAAFERRMAADYWEVGASGRRYDRELILRVLEERPPVDAEEAGWTCQNFGLRRIGGGDVSADVHAGSGGADHTPVNGVGEECGGLANFISSRDDCDGRG